MSLPDPFEQTAAADPAGGPSHVSQCEGCVGIVIGIPEPVAGELRRARAAAGDPAAQVVPPHITLVTTTPAEDWSTMLSHVREVTRRQPAFNVTLRGAASFRPVSPVVYINVEDGFDECTALHKELQSGPLARDLPFPFHPHVTVAHDVSEASMDAAEHALRNYRARFTVRTVGLYEHDANGLWKPCEELPLAD